MSAYEGIAMYRNETARIAKSLPKNLRRHFLKGVNAGYALRDIESQWHTDHWEWRSMHWDEIGINPGE